ncbi:MAG: hypothetical protein OHK93_006866 [Ramalina farinacea]|uniref:Uncharacterized protein n=1 Tax=Ramalina farinacea TaxID=258253 RepID=A0AA43QJC6_9LECA|nr:hypothetical protein [Ramalina farinacea]
MVAEPHTHPETQFFDESYSRYYDETSNLLPAQESPATKDRNITRLRKALPWLIHTTLFCSYVLLAVRAKAKSAQCFDDNVLQPPIQWEQSHFASAIETTPRVLNDTVDAGSSFHAFEDWSHSLDIGEISLSKEDISRMPVSMAAHYANKEEPSGELEVFHQLHCLSYLRSRIQNGDKAQASDGGSKHMEFAHDAHCFEYLWQTIKCHADVSVLSLDYSEGSQGFNATFDVVKQCRNFDAIHGWAKGRQTKNKPSELKWD